MFKKFVQTTQAASLLNLCPQRVRQLLKQGRIKGAFKNKRGFWQIPIEVGRGCRLWFPRRLKAP
jgi:hypothetical protein